LTTAPPARSVLRAIGYSRRTRNSCTTSLLKLVGAPRLPAPAACEKKALLLSAPSTRKLVWKPRIPPKERSPFVPEVSPRGFLRHPRREQREVGKAPSGEGEAGDGAGIDQGGNTVGLGLHGRRVSPVTVTVSLFSATRSWNWISVCRPNLHPNAILQFRLHARRRKPATVYSPGCSN